MIDFFGKQWGKILKDFYYTNKLSKEIYLKLLNLHKYNNVLTCEICKEPINNQNDNKKFSIDHIIPRYKGGNNNIENLRIAHRKCNSERRR